MALKIYRISLLSLFFLFCFQICSSQEAYKIDWNTERVNLSAGLVGNGIGLSLLYLTPDLRYEQWKNLDPQDINRFDRIALEFDSGTADYYSDILGNGSAVLPLLVYLAKIKDKDWRSSSIMYLEVLMFNGAITNISKYGFRRTRPYVYNLDLQERESVGFSGRASYISGHTSFAASNSFFAAYLFHQAYPDSAFVPFVYSVCAIIPSMTGYYRVRAGKHFPTDVISGYLVGLTVASFVIQSHKREDISLRAGANSLSLVKTF